MFGTAVLLLLFAAFTPWACLAQQTCYIKPRSDTPCPGEPCFTLSQYTREQCNASNTTLFFLPGTHHLNNRMAFTGIDSISLVRDQSSDSQVRIECTDSGFFDFFEIDTLHISGFDFVSCGSEFYWGILIHTVNDCQLINFSMQKSGGMLIDNSIVLFSGNTNFENNNFDGGVVVYDSKVTFTGKCNFACNTDVNYRGGAVLAYENVMLKFTGTSTFKNNSADNGGAVYISDNSILSFAGNVSFVNNTAQNGGALSLSADAQYILYPNTTLYFDRNRARQLGGAIRVEVRDFEYCMTSSSIEERCFFHISSGDFEHSHVNMIFTDNYAGKAGSVLFGGSLDTCLQLYQDVVVFCIFENDTPYVLNSIADFEANITTSMVSSYPFKICACDENSKEVNCTNSSIAISAYPGQRFHVSAAVVEESERTVPAVVQVLQGGDKIGNLPNTQETNNICSDLEFAVFSNSSSETLSLSAQGPCLGLNNFSVSVKLQHCPRGFKLDKDLACDCEERLRFQPYTSTCNIDNQTILRTERFWFGFDNESGGDGLILHEGCPFYYCVDCSLDVSVTNPDMQCDNNRGGLLCGGCKPGFSLTLGNPHCWECSNRYFALLIPFAVAGVVIVLLLYVLDLTVPHGTLSGLIFYANIVSVTWRAFPHEEFSFLQMFIAWLNLDLGIETCFYNGLDVYAKMWLQFVFPIYIWALVGVIVMISRYSSKVTKLLGTNSVSVLATLLFLTYTKILRTIIIAIAFASLEYPDNETHVVWLYDANIKYLKGKHIVLFVAALVFFLVLFTPYTLFLIFGQWLLAKSHLRVFKWVNRLKPFLDAYHSPYKPKHRYWPGLLLFIRCILSLALAFNIIGNPTLDFLYVSTGAIVVLTWGWIAGGMYKNWYLDALEASFVLNLGVFAASCYQTVTEEGNTIYTNKKHKAIAYTFTGVAFLEFLGILAYHIYLKFRHAKPNMNRKQLQVSLTQFVRRQSSSKEEDICHTGSSFANGESAKSSRSPTVSYISLSTSKSTDASDPQLSPRQSLTTSYDACLIREPLLGSDFHEQS